MAQMADVLMEAWMKEPLLNANAKVAQWHVSQQKCGFKFRVTQILGYLTGGKCSIYGQKDTHTHVASTAHTL